MRAGIGTEEGTPRGVPAIHIAILPTPASARKPVPPWSHMDPSVAFKHVSATRWDGSHPNARAFGMGAPQSAQRYSHVPALNHCHTA